MIMPKKIIIPHVIASKCMYDLERSEVARCGKYQNPYKAKEINKYNAAHKYMHIVICDCMVI